MNRSLTALFAALESLLVVGIGVGLLLVPLTGLWAFQYELQVDWVVFYRAAVDGWLVGHGADLSVVIPSDAAGNTIPPFAVTMAALGIALLTVLLGARAGRRLRGTEHPAVALGAALGAFAALATILTLTAGSPEVQPTVWQGIVFPTGVFLLGMGLGLVIAGPEDRVVAVTSHPGTAAAWRDRVLDRFPPAVVTAAAWSLRLGGMAVAALFAVSAVLVAALLAMGYSGVISLYESMQAGALGGFALTMGQLALLPNLVVWAAAWLIGPGFRIGTGSLVSPLGTDLGPIPTLPVLGALPTGDLPFGFAGLAVPIALAFVVGAVIAPRLKADLASASPMRDLALTAAGGGVFGGLVLTGISAAASGSVGAGRLVDVGPEPWQVGGIAAVELAVGLVLGALAGARRGADASRS